MNSNFFQPPFGNSFSNNYYDGRKFGQTIPSAFHFGSSNNQVSCLLQAVQNLQFLVNNNHAGQSNTTGNTFSWRSSLDNHNRFHPEDNRAPFHFQAPLHKQNSKTRKAKSKRRRKAANAQLFKANVTSRYENAPPFITTDNTYNNDQHYQSRPNLNEFWFDNSFTVSNDYRKLCSTFYEPNYNSHASYNNSNESHNNSYEPCDDSHEFSYSPPPLMNLNCNPPFHSNNEFQGHGKKRLLVSPESKCKRLKVAPIKNIISKQKKKSKRKQRNRNSSIQSKVDHNFDILKNWSNMRITNPHKNLSKRFGHEKIVDSNSSNEECNDIFIYCTAPYEQVLQVLLVEQFKLLKLLDGRDDMHSSRFNQVINQLNYLSNQQKNVKEAIQTAIRLYQLFQDENCNFDAEFIDSNRLKSTTYVYPVIKSFRQFYGNA